MQIYKIIKIFHNISAGKKYMRWKIDFCDVGGKFLHFFVTFAPNDQ